MNLTSGTLLERGKYRIISTLGRGGFGITYLAEQVLARRKVCIKEFFPKDYYKRDEGSDSISILSAGQAATMSRFKEKFLKEAQTIAALDHANIIHILDVFEENNTAYYVMEYVEGESLNEVVKHCGAMAEGEAVEYVSQVASALEYLHQRKIMHLDVKPGNMMLRRKDNRVVLIDFGLSKHYDEQSGEATSTTPVGVSHGYAPLEQYKQGGVSTFSPETDIYSLGATLYYLLTGQRPPEAASLINDPLEFPQHISATLRSAITAAMSPSSKQRPASVGKFVAMLNKADVTIIERPVTPKKPLDNKPKSKSGKWWLWSLLLVVVIAIVCAVVMNVGDDSPDVNPDVNTNGVVQPKSELSLLSDNIMNYDHNNGQGTIDYSLPNSEDVPSVTCDESWVTIGSISNSNTIFDVAANSGEESRSATINVEYNGQYFSVKLSQSGKPVLSLNSEESISFDHNKGQGTINYSLTNSEDVPTVTCDESWVTIGSISNSNTITYDVAANSSEESRSATINVEYNGQYFSVKLSQSGKPVLRLKSKESISFNRNKGQGTINYSLTNCDDVPNVTSNKNWVTIASVSKSGTIKFSVAANSGKESRSATINVEYNGQYFSVKLSQSGKPVLNLKSKESISFDHNKGQGTIDYSLTNSEDVPTVICDKSWVTITSVSKSGTIKFSVAANSSEESRSATIKVEYNGQHFNVTITQSGKTYKVGDYYNENGKEGIVFEVWDGGRHGKIVSLDKTVAAWDSRVEWDGSEWINGTKTYADSESDGKANTDKLMSSSDSQCFHAAKWCRGKGVSWYLPALNELKTIYNNKDKINNSLTKVGAETLNYQYWSSTEEDELCAWRVYMSHGYTSNLTKRCDYYVRAVSAF